MPRSSERIKAKKRSAIDESEAQSKKTQTTTADGRGKATDAEAMAHDDDEDVEEGEAEARRPRKKARTASSKGKNVAQYSEDSKKKERMPEEFRKVRGKRGLLEKLAKDVPMDVIFEIFCYLEPGDLLRLARSSKDLRGILMSKTSESIWRTARSNVPGLPPRPNDLNEPQYAHLLFESYCHRCQHKGRCDTVLWTFRMRCCKSCIEQSFPKFEELRQRLGLDGRFYNILPSERVHLGNTHRYTLISYTSVGRAIKEEFEALTGDAARSRWIDHMRAERQAAKEHAQLCERWLQARLSRRADELTDIRADRKEAILERLEEIGWREEAEALSAKSKGYRYRPDEFATHKLVKQSKKLTNQGWNKIKDELVEFLSEQKEKRLAEERRTILGSRYQRLQKLYYELRSTMDVREPFPAMGDLLLSKAIEKLVWDAPIDQTFPEDVLSAALSKHTSSMITKWKSSAERMLLDVLKRAVPTATASDLRLATTVFECQECNYLLQFPNMFHHYCCLRRMPEESEDIERMQIYDRSGTSAPKGPWRIHKLCYNAFASQRTSAVVKACDLDPSRATVQDLYAADPLIECVDCNAPVTTYYGGRLFMRWPLPLSHSRLHSFVTNSFGDDTERIRAAEPAESLIGRSNIESVHCAHCHKPHTRPSLVSHLKDAHGITLDSLTLETMDEHWYWSPLCEGRVIRESFRYRPPEPPAAASEQ